MDGRLLALAAATALAAGCDTAGRETAGEADTSTARTVDSEQHARSARTGSLHIGEQQYNFDIGLCSIQQPASLKRFMLVGSGTTEDGRRFTVNADGTPSVTAIVLRVQGNYGPQKQHSARIEPDQVRIDNRMISATGEFGSGEGRQSGQLNARCGDATSTAEPSAA